MAKFTDEEMSYAAALAYLDFKEEVIREHPDWTIGQHLESPQNADLKQQFMDRMGPDRYEDFISGEYKDWKIIDSQNNNGWDGNGFAACTIDTGDGNAIVGFRGSEVNSADDFLHDWLIADVGLVNETQTSQQRYAEEYLNRINNKFGDDYDNFSITGHSLGGNLAEHATLTAPDSMADKIDRCLSFDGPGFSDEYLEKYADQIKDNAHLVDHYQASAVGTMLNPVPGTNYRHIEVKDGASGFKRHNIKNFVFDDGGYVRPGVPDALAAFFATLSNTVDDNTSLPGILSLIDIIRNMDPEYAGELSKDSIMNLFNYAKDVINRVIRDGKPTDFRISTPVLSGSSEVALNVSSILANDAAEVDAVKSEISLLLKAASLFTISYKLKKSSSNLEKLAKRAGKVGDGGEKIVTFYENCENNVAQNAGA
ncbi:MAG: DUF2974 domain-containing protein [Clostridia bacterium]|nr:DUF2974 domain-containing protein [Clostridia bacterium]